MIRQLNGIDISYFKQDVVSLVEKYKQSCQHKNSFNVYFEKDESMIGLFNYPVNPCAFVWPIVNEFNPDHYKDQFLELGFKGMTFFYKDGVKFENQIDSFHIPAFYYPMFTFFQDAMGKMKYPMNGNIISIKWCTNEL